MCQLLGISANRDIDIDFSLKEFSHRGKSNPHGWGFAFLKNKKWEIIKKETSLAYEDITQEQFRFKSKIIIGHVRLASCGASKHENTHPFNIENWVFAHNGTIREFEKFPLGIWKPKGKTDSEHVFCYLFEKINSNPSQVVEILKEEAEKIKKHGKFNFLLSDGDILYAYGDDSLYYVQRKAPFQFARLQDEEYEVNLAEIKAPDEKAILVATEPLTSNEKWQKFSGLKIFKDGESL